MGLLAGTITAQIPRIVVQGSGDPQLYTSVDSAITAAQANDVLYFSGGNFTFNESVVVDKPLHFIGAGIHPDSTLATGTTTFIFNNSGILLSITESGSGSSFTGIYFAQPQIRYGTGPDDEHVDNILFQRCRFGWGTLNLAFTTSDNAPAMPELVTTFDECVIHSVIQGRKRGAVLTRCIIDAHGIGVYAITSFSGGSLTVDNCVFLKSFMGNCTYATVRNSIFTATNYICFNCSGGTITNVISAATNWFYTGGATITNSLLGADPTTFFVSETNDWYDFSDDLHMGPDSPGVNFGSDGNDIGIYGSSSPYKAGAIPFNPHYSQAIIAPATNSNGELPVNLRVGAQQH